MSLMSIINCYSLQLIEFVWFETCPYSLDDLWATKPHFFYFSYIAPLLCFKVLLGIAQGSKRASHKIFILQNEISVH
jgi:hypothetical protein